MGYIDLIALCIVCATVLAIYLLERRFLAAMRRDTEAHADEAETWAALALAHKAEAHKQADLADQHATRASAAADRACEAGDKERAKVLSRLDSLEMRVR